MKEKPIKTITKKRHIKTSMEVHHHPELPHGEKKRFKEYILEFLMIFLAVSMGFIAESFREHLSDNAKEREYIAGMVKDLGVDTFRLHDAIAETILQSKGVDSILKVSKDKISQVPVQDSLFQLTTRYLFYSNNFRDDDATLTQLRNAGGYRLIRKSNVVDSMAEYESRIKDINDEYADLFTAIENARNRADLVFDLTNGHNFRLHPNATVILITNEKEKIYNYYNGCWEVSISLDGYRNMLEKHLNYTTRLIDLLKKEYDVE